MKHLATMHGQANIRYLYGMNRNIIKSSPARLPSGSAGGITKNIAIDPNADNIATFLPF